MRVVLFILTVLITLIVVAMDGWKFWENKMKDKSAKTGISAFIEFVHKAKDEGCEWNTMKIMTGSGILSISPDLKQHQVDVIRSSIQTVAQNMRKHKRPKYLKEEEIDETDEDGEMDDDKETKETEIEEEQSKDNDGDSSMTQKSSRKIRKKKARPATTDNTKKSAESESKNKQSRAENKVYEYISVYLIV